MTVAYFAIALLTLATAYSAVVSFRQKAESATASWLFPSPLRRPARIIIGFATLVLVIGVGAWIRFNVASSNTSNPAPRSFHFLIPEGYTGWVRVEFEIPGAPPLPSESGYTLVKIPPSGTLKTSSSEQHGSANDDYDSYSNDALRPLPYSGPEKRVWGKITGELQGPSGRKKYEEFFVGTQEQFKAQALSLKPEE
jgi:hypothetical protein